jgi:sugar lactone lactonase YvrE
MIRRLLFTVGLIAGLGVATPAGAEPFPDSIALPVDFQPEGIALGTGATFYVGSLTTGDIFRGDLRSGAGEVFIHAPAGRAALGLKVDEPHKLLFVAGGATGAAYVYSTRTGAPVATYQFATAGAALLNDVVVTQDGVYFTDSFAPVLYKIPLGVRGSLGPGETIVLTGPAAFIDPSTPNVNGIDASADGSTLIINHTALGALFTVDPATGASALIDVAGLLPGTPDGLLLRGHSLWVVENFANTVVHVRLSSDLSTGAITSTITSPLFDVPTTAALHGDRLALVNGRFDLGLPPPFGPGAPVGTSFDVVLVRAN